MRQLVGFGRFPHSKGRLNAKDEAIIDRYIGFLDLEDLQARYLDQLSGGQRQRAYVAMVLAQETDYRPAGRTSQQPGYRAQRRDDDDAGTSCPRVFTHHRHRPA